MTVTVPAGAGQLLVRIFRSGGRRRGFADASDWDPDHVGINLVLAGQGEYRIQGRCWALTPGCVFVRWPGRRHSTWGNTDYAECSLGFAACWKPHLEALGILPSTPVLPGWPQPQSADLLEHLATDLQQAMPGDGPELLVRAATLAARIIRRAQDGADGVAALRAAIEQAPEARPKACSRSTKMAFQARLGMTPLMYRQKQRLTRAAALLTQGCSVKTVANALGYSSPEALSVQFRAHYGHPPRHARRATSPP